MAGAGRAVVGDSSTQTPSCSASWATEQVLHAGLAAADASCSACDCSPPAGGSCTLPQFSLYSSQNCVGVVIPQPTPQAANSCETFVTSASNEGVVVVAVSVNSPGSCAPGGGVPSLPLVSWSVDGVMCAGALSEAGGCPSDQRCVPAPAGPFGTAPCIYQAGDVACPADYADKSLLYGGHDDTRGCSACDCAAPTGRSCSGPIELYTDLACRSAATLAPADGATCTPFASTGTTSSFFFDPVGPSGGSCATSGGDPTGEATPTDAVTVCCEPSP